MNCVSLVILLFVRQIRMIYLLKLDNQAVDKKNTEDSPCANVNYINLCILCYDCLDLPGRSKTSKVRRRSAKDGKEQKNIPQGKVTVELLVGRCPGESLGKAYIGWSLLSHIKSEEVSRAQT